MGYTGLSMWGGRPQEDFLKELRGQEAFKRYNEMRLNSPVVGALLFAIEQSIRAVKWQFVSDDGPDDERIILANDAKAALEHSWNSFVSEALNCLWAGFALFYIVYQRDAGGRLLWSMFAPRGQATINRWLYEDTERVGKVTGVEQFAAPIYKTIVLPMPRLLHFVARDELGNPEGRSILRTAYTSYYYAKNIMRIEGIAVERDLAGLPHIKLPEGATRNENDSSSDAYAAAKLVRNIRNDEQAGLVTPPGWEFELVSTGGSRQFDTDKIINRYESRILMCALAQFMLLGQEGVGSLALSKDQTDFFTMSVNAIADIISDTFTKQALARLMELNGKDPNGIRLEHSPAGDFDVTAIVDLLARIGDKITWTLEDETWLRQVAKLPEMDIESLQAEKDARMQKTMEIARATAPKDRPQEDGKDNQGDDKSSVDEKKQMRATFLDALDRFRASMSSPQSEQSTQEHSESMLSRLAEKLSSIFKPTDNRQEDEVNLAALKELYEMQAKLTALTEKINTRQAPDGFGRMPMPEMYFNVPAPVVQNQVTVEPTPVTFSPTIQAAQPAAPSIIFSPQVNPTPMTVANTFAPNVQPAGVTVNVPPANVTVKNELPTVPVRIEQSSKTSVVGRDALGRATEIETETKYTPKSAK